MLLSGALVVAFSLKTAGQTKYPSVLLHTPDVPREFLEVLGLVWDSVREIEYVKNSSFRNFKDWENTRSVSTLKTLNYSF